MATTCKVCNSTGSGMISIYQHPNRVDSMYTFVSGIEVIQEKDAICIPCYDDLKIAHNFKQKCIQTNLLHKNASSRSEIKDEQRDDSLALSMCDSQAKSANTDSDLITTERSFEENNQLATCETGEDDELYTLLDLDRSSNVREEVSQETDCSDVTNKLDNTVDNEHLVPDAEAPSQSHTFSCVQCGKVFNRHGNLKRHQATVHLIIARSSKIGRNRNKRGPSPKPAENDVFATLKETQCEYCFIHFETEAQRSEHEIEHKSEEKPYRCFFENCKSQFKERFNFRKHYETHVKAKKYQCRYCDQRFSQLGNKKSHERYHTGERPYVCHHCGKSFAESGNLKAHIRYHTGERPYACPECPKRFTTHYSHKIHIRSHTKEKPYLCNDCGKRFSSSGKLLVHKRIHSGYRPYKCGVCSATFVDGSNLKRHSKTHN